MIAYNHISTIHFIIFYVKINLYTLISNMYISIYLNEKYSDLSFILKNGSIQIQSQRVNI